MFSLRKRKRCALSECQWNSPDQRRRKRRDGCMHFLVPVGPVSEGGRCRRGTHCRQTLRSGVGVPRPGPRLLLPSAVFPRGFSLERPPWGDTSGHLITCRGPCFHPVDGGLFKGRLFLTFLLPEQHFLIIENTKQLLDYAHCSSWYLP